MRLRYRIILSFLIVIAIIIIIAIIWNMVARVFKNEAEYDQYDPKKLEAFAKCLTQKEVVLYGAYWCSHCQRQKKLFGESFQYVTYVECTKDVKKCREKKIERFPTWIFKNGDRIKREATFAELAKKTACKAP